MKSRETELLVFYLAVDLALLNVSLTLVAWIDTGVTTSNFRTMSLYILHGNLAWIISYLVFTKKNLFLRDSIFNRLLRITKRQLVFYLVAAVLAVFFISGTFFRTFFLEYTLVFYLSKIAFYWIFYIYLQKRRRNRINSLNTAVVGCNDTGDLLKKLMLSNPLLGYSFIGYICKEQNSENFLGYPDDLEELIDRHNIQMIYYTISFFNGGNAEEAGKQVLKICNRKGVRLRFVPTNQRWFKNTSQNPESIGDLLVLNPQEIPMDNVAYRLQKRLFDLFFSLLVILLIFTWLYPLLFIFIKLSSKGPVIFKQKRTGINNKTFECYKFRSMHLNYDADTKQASVEDKRITKIGRILRRTNIDELPQFINVLKGDMSVVGPRPHMLKHTEEYSALIDQYLIRHYVKPGITGLAQIKGYRGVTRHLSAMENRVKADMEYIENWSFQLDMKIIWRTIFSKRAWQNAV